MIPGPIKIVKIPASGDLVRIESFTSWNYGGVTCWTDGYSEAPMAPDSPWLLRNPDTGETFWADECEEFGSHYLGDSSEYSGYPAPFVVAATAQNLQDQLREPSLSPEKEQYLRIRLWWRWNDALRRPRSKIEGHFFLEQQDPDTRTPPSKRDEAEIPSVDSACFDGNLRKLIPLLNSSEASDRLMAAEAWRQLGDHASAAELLKFDFPAKYHKRIEIIRAANDQGDRLVQRISDE